MDTSDLKRRAGITEGSMRVSTGNDPYDAAMNFMRGNNDDAFRATGGDIAKFAKILLMLKREGGDDEMMRLVTTAAKDRYQGFTRT
jgi:hypothetical protein